MKKIKDYIDDGYIIDQINNGATYEELAEHFGVDKVAMQKYCTDRGYIYKNRGHIKRVVTPRAYSGSIIKLCPQCKKEYNCYNVNEWAYSKVYRNKKYYFCGWNCMRAFEKERGID